jgi:transposase
VFSDAPTSAAADQRRPDLTARVAPASTKAGATGALRAWCQRVRASGRAECKGVLGTIERWMAKLAPSVQGRQPSGVVEGVNTRVTVLKRRGDGIFTSGRRFQRLTRDWHGDHRFGQPGPHHSSWPTTGIPGEPKFFGLAPMMERMR